jgi:hypothetical protein
MDFFTFSADDSFARFGDKVESALNRDSSGWHVEVDSVLQSKKIGRAGGVGGSLSAIRSALKSTGVEYNFDHERKRVMIGSFAPHQNE